MAREDRAASEDRLECLATGIAAGEAAQLGLDDFELLVERDDERQHHVDLRAHSRVELERDHPTSPFRCQ